MLVAADTVGGILDAVSYQVPVKRVFVGIDAFHAMAGHFFPVFMTAGAQFYDFGLGSAPSHAVSKMGVEILGPIFLGVTADTSGQGFVG